MAEIAETDFAEIERLAEKLRRDPKSRIFAQLADAYRKANMIDEALDVLKNGLDLHPNYATAHLVLSRCYLDKHMHEMAKDSLKKFVSLDPQSLVGFKLLAQTCERLGDEDGLILAYKGIMGLDPSDAQVRIRLDQLLKKKASEDIVASLSLAQEYENQGYIEKALEIYKKLSYHGHGDIELQKKVQQLSEKLKKVEEKKPEIIQIEGLETVAFFTPTTEVKPEEEKFAKIPPLEELLPSEPTKPELGLTKPGEPVAPLIETVKPEVLKPPTIEEPKIEVVKPSEEIKPVEKPKVVVQETVPVEPAKAEPPFEVTPLETLLEKTEPPTAAVEEPKKSVEEEVPSLEEFLAPAEEKPPEVKTEEIIPSVESLLKEEPTPEEKPAEKTELEKPKEEKPTDRPKGDDFQSFQEWLSGLLK